MELSRVGLISMALQGPSPVGLVANSDHGLSCVSPALMRFRPRTISGQARQHGDLRPLPRAHYGAYELRPRAIHRRGWRLTPTMGCRRVMNSAISDHSPEHTMGPSSADHRLSSVGLARRLDQKLSVVNRDAISDHSPEQTMGPARLRPSDRPALLLPAGSTTGPSLRGSDSEQVRPKDRLSWGSPAEC